MLLRLTDVRKRMLDVSTALRTVLDAPLEASQLFQSGESLIQCGPLAGGAVKNAPGTLRRWSRTGQQVGGNSIVNVGEIAAGFAIAKNRRLFPAQHLHTEFGEHSGIFRRRILPWPENIEVPQADGFEA